MVHFTPGTLYSNINFKLHTWLYTFIPWWTFNQEEQQRKLAEEREKRAAAAERRLAALAAQSAGTSGAAAAAANSVQKAAPDDNSCSCCFTSLAGKVPFHRYNYKYCSTTCMHLHSEMLQDEWGNCMLRFTWFFMVYLPHINSRRFTQFFIILLCAYKLLCEISLLRVHVFASCQNWTAVPPFVVQAGVLDSWII